MKLSLISLLTDAASEMLYPVMPVYLQSIGFSILLIGVLEGMVEAIAGFTKGYFGKHSDATGLRTPYVKWGYTASALSKPLLAISALPVWVFFCRMIDRLGKGVRTGARDAMLSDEATPETKGRIFGFHRAMDTAGAVIGPVIALIFLHFYPQKYQPLFLLAAVPGLLAIGVAMLLREKNKIAKREKPKEKLRLFSFLNYWKQSPKEYRRVAAGLLFFALINSSDVFLLLQLKAHGFSDSHVILAYIFYNLVYVIAAYPLGHLADRFGMRKMLMAGFGVFAVVYFGFATATASWQFLVLLALYGCYAAATEGVSKAWLTNIAGRANTATAIGTFSALQSIAILLASTAAGALWHWGGAALTFSISALGGIILAGYFLFLKTPKTAVM